MSIVVRTLSEQVLEILRDRIVSGRLPQEAIIRQDALASELGVSKIPLREALARLEQEGLLTSQANRGYFIRPMSIDAAEEIFELRLSIEPRATARAATLATDAERRVATQAYEALDAAANDPDGEVAVANRAFHTSLVRPGGRLLTTQLVERLAVQAERYVVAHLQPAGREDRAHVEHRELFDAWLAGDAEKTAALADTHIRGTLDDLRKELGTANSV
ncbi:MAG: GntR family transcriptional regulator [Sphingomonas sp.]|nr:GntR family transcriptional regulator [Sphingomonas sp.]|tara:strand:- start:1026 stop:1682 length:657 start_codon:yes stop_codon:yes gene_type:complete